MNKNRIFLFIALNFFLVLSGCFRKKYDGQTVIQPVATFSDVDFTVVEADTLVFFDVDDVLITACDPFARYTNHPLSFTIMTMFKHPSLAYDKQYCEHMFSLVFRDAERFVIEPMVVNVIQELKQRGVMVFGLTSMETGSFGVVENMPEWRYSMLNSLGITFTQNFPDSTFKSLPVYRNKYPALYKGIICCNQQPKGEVLGAFLDVFNINSKTIVFFDDDLKNCESVAQFCDKRSIAGKIYQYKFDQKLLPGQWDTWRALKQLDDVVAHEQWVDVIIDGTMCN